MTPAIWEEAFGYGKYVGANVDIGHFVAGNNMSPLPFIEQYHERVTQIHVKDRKMHDGPNVPFGLGDTPINCKRFATTNGAFRPSSSSKFRFRPGRIARPSF